MKKTRAEGFCASPGDGFKFSDENGKLWEGNCTRLIPHNDGSYELHGEVRKGDDEFINLPVSMSYDPATTVVEMVPA